MKSAFKYPAVEQAKKLLTELRRISFAPTAFLEYPDKSVLTPRATPIEEPTATA